MKKLFFLPLLFLLSSVTNYTQWTNQNPVPNGNTLWSTFFADDNTGWIVGSEGFIKKTTNAGLDWIQQSSGTTLTLRSVQFINQNTGWICGEEGLILKTTDGGQNWFELTSGTSEILTDIHFYDLNIGWVVGYGETILKTTNGGSSWTSQSSGTSFNLNSVDFVDALCGYTVGKNITPLSSKILKTTDGGVNWVDKSLSLSGIGFNSVEFINSNTGWIGSGENYFFSYIFKTTDGGDTWNQQNLQIFKPGVSYKRENLITDDDVGIRSIYFKDSNNGWAVNGNGTYCRAILTTTDGGFNWVTKYFGLEEYDLLSVFVNSIGQGWAVGYNGSIFRTDDNGQSWAQQLSGGVLYGGEDDIHSVFFVNENIGWAAGTRKSFSGVEECPLILKTTNGGKIWETKYYTFYHTIRSVFFKDENIGWAGGTEILLYTIDGGENWTMCNTDISSISSIFFIDQNTGWLASDNNYFNKEKPEMVQNIIAKSTDGGITWVQKSTVGGSSIYFSDINNGWVVGENGSIWKSTDGGETWISKTSGTTAKLNYVKFYASNLGICVGGTGTILLSNDGGETWVAQSSGTTNELKSVTFINSTSFWIAGSNGEILSTTDLGNNWTSYNEETTKNLNTIFFVNENTGWAGGLGGTLFKYQTDVVPVELISFTADVKDNKVQLSWQTATEVNNYGFEIERRIDEEDWNNIGFVEGHGNSISTKFYSFTDMSPIGGGKFQYRLKQIDTNGKYEYSNEVEVEIIPTKFALYQNYPNPFNPTTKIRFQLSNESKVIIKIYDMLGAEVLTLVDEIKEPGVYETELNAKNFASGTYIYKIIAGDFTETKKMVLIR